MIGVLMLLALKPGSMPGLQCTVAYNGAARGMQCASLLYFHQHASHALTLLQGHYDSWFSKVGGWLPKNVRLPAVRHIMPICSRHTAILPVAAVAASCCANQHAHTC